MDAGHSPIRKVRPGVHIFILDYTVPRHLISHSVYNRNWHKPAQVFCLSFWKLLDTVQWVLIYSWAALEQHSILLLLSQDTSSKIQANDKRTEGLVNSYPRLTNVSATALGDFTIGWIGRPETIAKNWKKPLENIEKNLASLLEAKKSLLEAEG